MAMAAIVLVVSCLNLANMMLARGTARRKEIAMRLALGGGRGRIVRQLLTEGLMLSLLGGAFGLLLAYWGVNLLVATLMPLSPVPLTFDGTPDVRIMAATLAFCVLSTLVFSLGPAWKLSRTSVVSELKEQGGEDSRARLRAFSARNLLVGTQIALSLALLTTAGLFTRGAIKAGQADPGYRYEGQVLAEVDTGLAGYDETQGRQVYRRLMDRLRGVPGVKSASFSSIVAFGGMTEGKTVQKGGTPPGRGKDGRAVGVRAVSYIVGSDYFATLGLQVLRGRDFTPAEEQDANAPPVASHRRAARARAVRPREPDRPADSVRARRRRRAGTRKRHRPERRQARDAADGSRRRGARPPARPVRQGSRRARLRAIRPAVPQRHERAPARRGERAGGRSGAAPGGAGEKSARWTSGFRCSA